MTHSITAKYLGGLRCELVHLKSQATVLTDAPVDNKGKGEAFSPTDLLAVSLASCMLTTMGIAADIKGFNIDGAFCQVTKIMQSDPRKIAEIKVEITFAKNNFDDHAKQILQRTAHQCPVSLSLNQDVKQNIIFNF
jgi:putative redox protein